MKNYYSLLLLLLFISCKSEKKVESENNVDAARNFIRAALDGKFTEARDFMLQDSVNVNYMDVAERAYQRADQATKDGYRASSIRIAPSGITEINDSTAIVIYSNSYKNDPDTLKVIRMNDKWLVDLKYLYLHDSDTLFNKPAASDTLK